ncbi:hypothetical protein SAMD00079811_81060 (plasmid) [Scytonema sp. HK-05]|nr:hypothetical protein SAMD00079811_81060 [Scytonema sp. HK-05]
MLNNIKQFIDSRGISRYRFWQDTGLGRDTAYRLCNDPTYIPTGGVLDKICATYKVQPGELLTWVPDDCSNQNVVAPLQNITSDTQSKTKTSSKEQQQPESIIKIILGSKSA